MTIVLLSSIAVTVIFSYGSFSGDNNDYFIVLAVMVMTVTVSEEVSATGALSVAATVAEIAATVVLLASVAAIVALAVAVTVV